MAGLDCAEISPAAWPTLQRGIAGTVTVTDAEAAAAMRDLEAVGLSVGESGAAALAGLRNLRLDAQRIDLGERLATGANTRVLVVATEGITGTASEEVGET
jgi:diaminopropionate ammonia-lyase